MFIFDKKSIRESKWEQKIIVHEIVVNLRIPPYTKRWFKEDDKISIDICLLFVLFPRKSKLRRTHFYGVANFNVDFIILVKYIQSSSSNFGDV